MAAPTSGRSRRTPLKAMLFSGGLLVVGALGYAAAKRTQAATPAVAAQPPRVADVPSAGA